MGENDSRMAAWGKLIVSALLLATGIVFLMQGYTPPGPAGEVIRHNQKEKIDATPLFYTELESVDGDE